jgi:predicted nucleic acid-binding protein
VIVVSDTSPITYLYQIARFGLLSSLYGEIVIPPAVERELRVAASIHHDLDWPFCGWLSPRAQS